MSRNDQYALTVLKQWMDNTAQWNRLQSTTLTEIIQNHLDQSGISYGSYLDQLIEEQDRLQVRIDRDWQLLQRWRRGENILLNKLRMDD